MEKIKYTASKFYETPHGNIEYMREVIIEVLSSWICVSATDYTKFKGIIVDAKSIVHGEGYKKFEKAKRRALSLLNKLITEKTFEGDLCLLSFPENITKKEGD